MLEMKSLCTSWGSILMSRSIDLSKIQLPDVSPRTIFIAIVVLLGVTFPRHTQNWWVIQLVGLLRMDNVGELPRIQSSLGLYKDTKVTGAFRI